MHEGHLVLCCGIICICIYIHVYTVGTAHHHFVGRGPVCTPLSSLWYRACSLVGFSQPKSISQLTVFFSHKKSAPASPNQHQHQPANRVIKKLKMKTSISTPMLYLSPFCIFSLLVINVLIHRAALCFSVTTTLRWVLEVTLKPSLSNLSTTLHHGRKA